MARDMERLRAATRRRKLQAQMEEVFAKALEVTLGPLMSSDTSLTAAVTTTDLSALMGRWKHEVKKNITPAMFRWFGEQFELAAGLLPAHANAFLGPNVRDVRALAYVKRVENRLVGIGDTAYDAATNALRTSLETGEGAASAATRVADSLQVSMGRATVIARTEANGAVNAADFSVAKELHAAGIVTMQTWLSTLDDRTRESHAEADGQSVPIGTPFVVGGEELEFPGDPEGDGGETIQCRCTTILEVADE